MGIHDLGHRFVPVGWWVVLAADPPDYSTAAGICQMTNSLGPSAAMLNALLNDTLDPGYRLAARRHVPRRRSDGPLVWVGCLAIGLLLVMAYQQSHRSAPAADLAKRDLISRIRAEQTTANQAAARAKQLSDEVAALRDAKLPGNRSDVANLGVLAGSVAVTGPGLTVRLSEPSASKNTDAAGRPGSVSPDRVAIIHDTDVRSVVNELWTDGAEAVAVNGIRLSSTSAIRFAGQAILVDFQPINSPYTVSAIGNRDLMQVRFTSSAAARELKTIQGVNGIGFDITSVATLRLPAVTVSDPHYALVGAVPTPTTSESSR
jgi:uncharacterized protein YlxW (UPF0749 family)